MGVASDSAARKKGVSQQRAFTVERVAVVMVTAATIISLKLKFLLGNFQWNVRVEGDADVGVFGVDFAERQFRRFRPQVERSLDLLADQRFVQVLCAFANAEIMKNLNFKQIEIEEFVST